MASTTGDFVVTYNCTSAVNGTVIYRYYPQTTDTFWFTGQQGTLEWQEPVQQAPPFRRSVEAVPANCGRRRIVLED